MEKHGTKSSHNSGALNKEPGISDIRREVDEICALLGYYAAYSGNFLTDVSGQPSGPIVKGQGA
jgi:hypothetical protein